ncbi:MAG TPA: DNA primase [Candidatus Merdenecus merdavium]|nr:DNA primase [Candidatus Merdenecus merdavium]
MYYSEDLVEEVRLKNDIIDVISAYVKLQRKGSSHFGLCPFHNEKSPSFSVSPSKQMYYCFGCGAGGNVFTFIMEYENYSFPEALKVLADRAGVTLPEVEYSQEARQQADLRSAILELNKKAAKYYYYQLRTEAGKQAYHYLTDRGLSEETIKKFGLGFSNKYSNDLYQYMKKEGYSDELLKQSGLMNVDEKRGMYDKFWNRVMFPIMDVNHRVIGFGGRVMGDGKPKYLNSPETKVFDKSRNLYGLNIARTSRKESLLICEGYMDVIALHQAGFHHAVASLGTALTTQQASLVKRYAKEVYLVYDSDEAGRKAALRAIPILKASGLSVKVINMKPYKDPDEFIKNLGAQEFEKRIDDATGSFMYEIEVLEKSYDMNDPESKTKFHNEIAVKLLEFTEDLERANYIEAVADKYHIGFDNLRKLVNNMAMKSGGIKEYVKPKSGLNRKKDKEDGMIMSQKLLLTWLIENEKLFQFIKKYITADDFTEEIFQKVASMLFTQYDEGMVNPAKIINYFTDPEEQREVAALFNASIPPVDTQEEREKAIKETMIRVKENSIEHRSAHMDVTDITQLQQVIMSKRHLQDLRNLKISLDSL